MATKKDTLIANPLAPELYADRTTSVALRGNVARITFASERATEDPHAPSLVVSGHLAMSMRGFLHLYAQMQSVVRQMEASGLVKNNESAVKAAPKSAAKKPSAAKKTAKKASPKGRAGAKKS